MAAADSYGGATIWNVRDGKEQCRVRHEKFITSMTFSPDGRFLIAGSDDNSVRFWNVASGKNDRTLKHDYQVTSLATIRDGQALLTGTSDRKVRLWNLNELPQPVEVLDQVLLPIRIEGSGDDGNESEPIRQGFPPTFIQPSRPPTPYEVEPADVNNVGYEREWILDSSVVQVAESSKTGDVLIATNSGIIWRTFRDDLNAHETPTQHLLDGGVLARTKSAARIVKEFENKHPELHQIWRLTVDDNPELEITTTRIDHDTRKFVAGYSLSGSFGVFTRTDSESALDGQFTKVDDLVFFSHATNLSTLTTIVCNQQNEVFAWNMRNHQRSSDPLRLTARVQRVILDPSGQRAFLSCADGTIRSWTPANGLALEIRRQLAAEIIDLAVSEDGHIVCCVTIDGRIETWRTDRFDPEVLKTRVSFIPSKVAIGPNGEMFAVGGEDGKLAVISASKLTIREVQGVSGEITHLEFNSSGTCLAATSKTELSFVPLDADQHSELKVCSKKVEDSEIVGVRFVGDKLDALPTLMTVLSNGRIATWERSNSLLKQRFIADLVMNDEAKNGLTGASIAKDGRRFLAYRSASETVHQVCETTTRELASIALLLNRMPVVTDRGLVVGLTPPNGLQTWRVAENAAAPTESPLTSRIERSSSLECLRTSVSGQRLAVAFHLSRPLTQFHKPIHIGELSPVGFLADDDEAQAISRCLVFDTSDVTKPPVSFRFENPLRLARFDSKDNFLLTADIVGGVSIWTLDRAAKQSQVLLQAEITSVHPLGDNDAAPKGAAPTEDPKTKKESKTPSIFDAAIAPHGKWFVLGCSDNVARVHHTNDGQECFPPLKHADQVAAVAISPNGDIIVSASLDDSVGIWNATTGERITSLPHRDDVVAVCFSPDGSLLLTGSSDTTAQFWDTKSWKPRGNPLMHGNTVTSVAFSPDGKLALTSSWDRTVRLWDVVTGLPICEPMPHELPVEQASFFPDGTAILANCSHGLSRVWRVPTPDARDPDALKLQVEVETGMIADSNGHLRRMTHAEWQQRSRHLSVLLSR